MQKFVKMMKNAHLNFVLLKTLDLFCRYVLYL